MNLTDLSKPLRCDQIDFRVQSINKGGFATILVYKDARVDMQRLDEVCGPLNWTRRHCRENHNCIVSIWDSEKGQWISKEDTGTESNTEKEKGLASDSFKRSCFNWGIGRELYDYPEIKIKLLGSGVANEKGFPVDQGGEWILDKKGYPKATFNLGLKNWIWHSQFTNGELSYLAAKKMTNNKFTKRFEWGEFTKG